MAKWCICKIHNKIVFNYCFVFVCFCYLMMTMYCIWGQRPSPSIDGWGMVLDDYDGQIVSGDNCGLNFLTFILQLKENPGKNLNQETDPIGIWTRARWMRGNSVTLRPQRWSVCLSWSIFPSIKAVFAILEDDMYFQIIALPAPYFMNLFLL